MTPCLSFGVSGVVSCMSRFIHPSKLIREKYPNLPKAHKLEDLILIAESEISIRRGGGLANGFARVDEPRHAAYNPADAKM